LAQGLVLRHRSQSMGGSSAQIEASIRGSSCPPKDCETPWSPEYRRDTRDSYDSRRRHFDGEPPRRRSLSRAQSALRTLSVVQAIANREKGYSKGAWMRAVPGTASAADLSLPKLGRRSSAPDSPSLLRDLERSISFEQMSA